MGYRLGVDAGGTFTDLLLFNDALRSQRGDKVAVFNYGPSIAELRRHSLAETGWAAPRRPVRRLGREALAIAAA